MSLPEAIAYARAHQPAIRAAIARLSAAEAETAVPRAQWYPTLGATAQFFGASANNTTASYVGVAPLDVPRIGGTRVVSRGAWKPYASTFAGIGAAQEIFDFGRIAAQSAAADALVDVEKQRARTDQLDVSYDVEEAYFAVFAAKSILAASEQAYARSRAHRDLARAGVQAGLRSPIEGTRAEADLARFEIARTKARGGIETAQAVLAAAVGLPDELLDIAEAPPNPRDMPTLTDAVRRASSRTPLILSAIAELKAEQAKTRAIGAEFRPDLVLTGTFSGRAGGAPASGNGSPATDSGFIPNVPNWDVGVVLSWPLFDETVIARKRASAVRERVRSEELSLAKQRQVARVRQAYVVVDVARASLPGLRRSAEAARANYDQAEARFKAGLGTSVELADAEAIRTDAEIQLALGQFELARARAEFGRAIAEGV
jgi:outer membrane protein TolC